MESRASGSGRWTGGRQAEDAAAREGAAGRSVPPHGGRRRGEGASGRSVSPHGGRRRTRVAAAQRVPRRRSRHSLAGACCAKRRRADSRSEPARGWEPPQTAGSRGTSLGCRPVLQDPVEVLLSSEVSFDFGCLFEKWRPPPVGYIYLYDFPRVQWRRTAISPGRTRAGPGGRMGVSGRPNPSPKRYTERLPGAVVGAVRRG